MSVRGTHVPAHLRLPIAGVTPPPTEAGGQRLFPTGNFRFFRPVSSCSASAASRSGAASGPARRN
jgi:hypothetical protein